MEYEFDIILVLSVESLMLYLSGLGNTSCSDRWLHWQSLQTPALDRRCNGCWTTERKVARHGTGPG